MVCNSAASVTSSSKKRVEMINGCLVNGNHNGIDGFVLITNVETKWFRNSARKGSWFISEVSTVRCKRLENENGSRALHNNVLIIFSVEEQDLLHILVAFVWLKRTVYWLQIHYCRSIESFNLKLWEEWTRRDWLCMRLSNFSICPRGTLCNFLKTVEFVTRRAAVVNPLNLWLK